MRNVVAARRAGWMSLVLAAVPLAAAAQPLPPPVANVVSLTASAQQEVSNDWLSIVFSTSRDGSDAAAVQSLLRQALDSALAEARKVARPGQLEVQTGGFSLAPRYAPPSAKGQAGGIVGWSGSAEMIVQGRDTAAIGQLAGRIQTMTIARTGFSLSREARDKVEAEITAQAIARFRARAEAVTREFGLASWSVREVNVGGDEARGGPAPVFMRAQSARSAGEESQPLEAGKSVVSTTVSGSVQMAR